VAGAVAAPRVGHYRHRSPAFCTSRCPERPSPTFMSREGQGANLSNFQIPPKATARCSQVGVLMDEEHNWESIICYSYGSQVYPGMFVAGAAGYH
jgi:hypothetical protein